MELIKQPTLADSICDMRSRKIKRTFFNQINNLIDWASITAIINQHYTKGKSATGKPSYSGLLLFKMSLLQTWYGLSDYEVEDRVNDSISFSYFCGLNIDQVAPDHSTLSRFRTIMTSAKAYQPLFKAINQQLESHDIIIKTGAIVDASVIDTPLKPKGKTNYKVTEDREDEQEVEVTKEFSDSVDKDAAWLKKSGKYRYGYKKHYVTDNEGLVLGVVTTKASTNEVSNLEEVLDAADLPEHIALKADKGYQSKKNSDILKKKKLKNHILKKAYKNKPLTKWEQRFNKLIGKTRFKVERTFGGIKRWFGGGVARYRGIKKMHTQNLMEAMCYNLYRSPGILASNCKN
ncbi:MAG: IS5 family transposase [Winogradskyella sp.]|uniref:IS5 family transposase n=1 Tax=Winogradskyella sp. TaxID=1883156 RepID=UPI0017B41D8E|nr:IS5 family transposase [Winogradskyella sp.]MBT8244376.1 IS5 family transposase [Winogradskyella sp.]NNK23311.1 IS5 family transposase [Winogradskyella sp.]